MAKKCKPKPKPKPGPGYEKEDTSKATPTLTPNKAAKWIADFSSRDADTVRGGRYAHFKPIPFDHLTHVRAIAGLWEAFGVPSGLVRSDWKKFSRELLEASGGVLRRSPLRALLQGEFPNVPLPAHTYRQKKKIEQVLALADIAETIAYNEVLGKIKEDNE